VVAVVLDSTLILLGLQQLAQVHRATMVVVAAVVTIQLQVMVAVVEQVVVVKVEEQLSEVMELSTLVAVVVVLIQAAVIAVAQDLLLLDI
jgi:hypothetical protein